MSRDKAPRANQLLILQVDGLGHAAFQTALRSGAMPRLNKLIESDMWSLHQWKCGLPSDTPPVQGALFWGKASTIPGFGWWDRSAQQRISATHPRTMARVEASIRAKSVRPGLLHQGTCHGATLAGDAIHGTITGAVARGRLLASAVATARATVALARNPRTVAQIAHELWETVLCASARTFATGSRAPEGTSVQVGAHGRRREPIPPHRTIRKRLWHGLIRIGADVFARKIVVEAVRQDLADAVPVIFAGFIGFDVIAHQEGPGSPACLRTLNKIDHEIALLHDLARRFAPETCVVVLSDHGMEESRPASQKTSYLPCAELGLRWQRHVIGANPPQLEAVACGPLLQLWVRDRANRLDRTQIEGLAPSFIHQTLTDPTIDYVIAVQSWWPTSTTGSPLRRPNCVAIIGRSGEIHLELQRSSSTLQPTAEPGSPTVGCVVQIRGTSPLKQVSNSRDVCNAIACFMTNELVGDLVIVAARETLAHPLPRTRPHDTIPSESSLAEAYGRLWSFEDQYGAHGAIDGEQAAPFVLLPRSVRVTGAHLRDTIGMHDLLWSLRSPTDRSIIGFPVEPLPAS